MPTDYFVACFVGGPLDSDRRALDFDPCTGGPVDPNLPPRHLHIRHAPPMSELKGLPDGSRIPRIESTYFLTSDPHGDGFVYVHDPLSEKVLP